MAPRGTWIKLPTALLLVTCALTATSTGRAAPCPALGYYKQLGYKTGRNIKLQSACTCGANANQTLDVCEKYHYCDASKTSGQRCSSRPFDKCEYTDGKTRNDEANGDCKCDNKYGNIKADDCTAVSGRFCNADNSYGCSLTNPYAKTSAPAPGPSAGSLTPLENLGPKACTTSTPCSTCQGNCVNDDDCRGTLQCYRTESSVDNPISGCGMEGMKLWYGYCYCDSDSIIPCDVWTPSSSLEVDDGGIWFALPLPYIVAVIFCAVLQVALCIKDRKRWKPNLVPYSAEHTQPLQLGTSASDAYAWLERWAANGAKWIVPSDCKEGQSGQTEGQGFHVGARFVTTYSKQTWSRGHGGGNHGGRGGRMHTTHTNTSWDVLEADQNQCLVKFRSQTKAKTTGVSQMGNPGRGHLDCTFHFQNGPNGWCVLVITSTMYSDTNADFVWWKNLLLILWFVPCCQCIMCYVTFSLRCWHDASDDSRQGTIVQANKVVGQRISMALQRTVQSNNNNNMQQQSQTMLLATAHEVVQQPVIAALPGSMAMGSVVAVAPQPQLFQVQLPSGCTAGQLLTVQAPNGQQVQISVPTNGVPGQILQLPYPNNRQPPLMTASGATVYPMDAV